MTCRTRYTWATSLPSVNNLSASVNFRTTCSGVCLLRVAIASFKPSRPRHGLRRLSHTPARTSGSGQVQPSTRVSVSTYHEFVAGPDRRLSLAASRRWCVGAAGVVAAVDRRWLAELTGRWFRREYCTSIHWTCHREVRASWFLLVLRYMSAHGRWSERPSG